MTASEYAVRFWGAHIVAVLAHEMRSYVALTWLILVPCKVHVKFSRSVTHSCCQLSTFLLYVVMTRNPVIVCPLTSTPPFWDRLEINGMLGY